MGRPTLRNLPGFENEIAKYGDYRTARLVLDAWDRMERADDWLS